MTKTLLAVLLAACVVSVGASGAESPAAPAGSAGSAHPGSWGSSRNADSADADATAVAALEADSADVAGPAGAATRARRPFKIDDLYRAKRISDVRLSPDGSRIAFTLATSDLEANRNTTDVWVVSRDGKTQRRLTDHAANDRNPAWSPDGKTIVFESTRSGGSHIWLVPAEGGPARQLTTLSTGASQPAWSPDGETIAFVSDVFPEFSHLPFSASDSLNKGKLLARASNPVKAEVFTRLLYRHWDHWVQGKRSHIFVQPVAGGAPADLTPGDRDAVPTSTTFSDAPDFVFSPDGREIVFTATPVPPEEEAWSTNHDLYAVAVAGGGLRQLTANPAADAAPRFSPDGRYLAYIAQARPGFEADRWTLMLLEKGAKEPRAVTASFDASVRSPVWSRDSKTIFFLSDRNAEVGVFSVQTEGSQVNEVFVSGANESLNPLPDGRGLVFSRSTAVRPAEIFRLQAGPQDSRADENSRDNAPARLVQITRVNDSLFSTLDIPPPRSITYGGEDGTRVQGWVFVPSAFDPARKYPLIMLVHGGPQSAWKNGWSYRWNPALWAARGYVVFAPNPRGSTGFGQEFVEGVSRDWGGKAFTDLVRGLDTVSTFPYIDRSRIGAAGASFGGYMVNWFQARIPERFAVFVTHNGIYNLASAYGTTEELWFDEWERDGTPWTHPEHYTRDSPSRYAGNFRTPHLVIHGAFDFRIDDGEAMQLFTALQRQKVPSRYLYFPDEGHWVLKPANSKFWHQTVFEWLSHHLHPEEIKQ